MSTDAEFMAGWINENLAGKIIVGAVVTDDHESFGFAVSPQGGADDTKIETVWVDCDAEGNGAGWLKIDEPEPTSAACADCGTSASPDDIGTTCRSCGRGVIKGAS